YLVGHQLRHASQVYGYFASVLGLVSWIYLGAQMTLYAAELNVVRSRRLWPRSIVQPPLTEADVRTFDFIARQGERRPEQAVHSRWDPGVEAQPPPREDAPVEPADDGSADTA
ncbi:MAG: YihY/virulence factor BrkB family protein, partial [Acidimicrobiales bacterium]